MKSLTAILIIFLLQAGTTSYAQNTKELVIVLPMKIPAPADAKKVGNIKVGNNAVSVHCDYEGLIMEAKDKARAMGGNIVKITKLADPTFISKCYRIEADVYHLDKLPEDLLPKTNAPVNADLPHVTLYIYRLKDTITFGTSYHVHLDDSVICTVRSRSRDSVKVYKEGKIKLWAETEKKTVLNLDTKFGNTYYIRCGLVKGEIRMLPVIEAVDKSVGAPEYGKPEKGKKDGDVKYLQQIH